MGNGKTVWLDTFLQERSIRSLLDLIQDNRCRSSADQSVGISECSIQNHAIIQREIACLPTFPNEVLGKCGFPNLSRPGEKHDWKVLEGLYHGRLQISPYHG